ncbi:cysteine desulfurase family protein [Caldicoprobacter guelmensis]|uniref:cysteine desulfurase family protein n=1 Tax=Caldicoprobacter guelmensis TaxID=1170224 RepID=UPI00195685EC|nr:cysteine desulfurase family protein [Caldicoprobacter guelmensis]
MRRHGTVEHEIYLDNAATTPVYPDVARAVMKCMIEDFGNPSSLHRMGLRAERKLKEARERIASALGVDADGIFFTSGGTEANNLAIVGTALARKREGRHCITTQIEHPSVLNTFKYLEKEGWEVTYLPVNKEGVISLDDLKKALRPDTVLVSIMHVNNEIGSIQPVNEISNLLKTHGNAPVFHVDAVQSFGKLTLKPAQWGIDLLSISGHKVHAPKGIGALYIRKGVKIHPLQWGGGQEKGVRSGTENMPGIVGFGEAVRWLEEVDRDYLYRLKGILVAELIERVPSAVINGPSPEKGAPHILSVSFPGIRGEVMLHALEEKGVYVGTGSACSSKKGHVSHVLEAIGSRKDIAQGAIRISLSYLNTEDDVRRAAGLIQECVKELEGFVRR